MPFPHQRRRGATVLFRRKIPADLRDRFGCSEIVRSLGRVTPGEARRITHHLWSQMELAFMFVRRAPNLTRDEIAKIVHVTVSDFRDQVDLAIADVRPGVALEWLNEPAQVAAGLRGSAAALENTLVRNDLSAISARAQSCSRAVLDKDLNPDGADVRRLARAMTAAACGEMRSASQYFEVLAGERPKDERNFSADAVAFECTSEDLALLRSAKVGDNLAHVLARLRPVAASEVAEPQPAALEIKLEPAAPVLRNAHMTISELWPMFCASKVAMEEWKPNEEISAKTALKLWMQVLGDRPPSAYTAGDVSRLHKALRQLPSKYYHNKKFRLIYEREGVLGVIAATTGQDVDRMHAKTWNSHNSVLNGFFEWCAIKGDVLTTGTTSICANEFVKIPKKRRKRADDMSRRIYQLPEIEKIFSAHKYMGCRSQRDWKTPGPLIYRDHRYWLTLINALHGNRREEPVVLRVKHVKHTAAGVWFFNWAAPELASLLKDIGSPRDVPLHHVLLKLGFIEARVLGREPEEPLFPEALSHGQMCRHGEPYGKWFGLFSTHCGVDDPELDTHAWRHTVVTYLTQAGVPPALIEELVGHESEGRRSELSTYTHAASIDLLKEMIDKLELPIDVVALNAARVRSDTIDRSTAWPNLSDTDIKPKPKRKGAK